MLDKNRDTQKETVMYPPEEDTSSEQVDATFEGDRVIHEEVVQTGEGISFKRVAEETTVVPSETTLRKAQYTRTRRAVYFTVHVITIFILIRFVLLALGANPESAFAGFIYAITYPFVAPFLGLFGLAREPQYGISILEMSDIVAIAIYYLFAWIITGTLRFVYRPKTVSERSS